MSSQPEARIVGAIIMHIRKLDCPSWARKVHGNRYSDAGEPDVDAVVCGVPLKIEVKVPGKHPTDSQNASLRRWERAGAVAGCAHSVEEADDLVELCLSQAGWSLGDAKRLLGRG